MRVKTQILFHKLAVVLFPKLMSQSYLAPRIMVSIRKRALSIKVYNNAGIVDSAAFQLAIHLDYDTRKREHTTHKQCQRSKRPIFRLESLQQRRQSKDIHDSVEEAGMHKRESIRPIHYTPHHELA